jgi:4-amino-4-deoxy-L-arabinose transferase-like glycosyltransferase
MDIVKPRWRPPLGLGLGAVLSMAAALRLWRLDQNGFGNEYYTAGVRSMSQSWHNFVYNAFDPAGFISVDKPPVALWIQVASVSSSAFTP